MAPTWSANDIFVTHIYSYCFLLTIIVSYKQVYEARLQLHQPGESWKISCDNLFTTESLVDISSAIFVRGQWNYKQTHACL